MNVQKSKPITFLLVEDDDSHAKIAMRTFGKERAKNLMVRVKDGEEALAFLRKEERFLTAETPDVILLDLNLPKLSGLELLRVIKEDTVLSCLPVIVLTTSDAERDRLKAYKLHVSEYLLKPLKPSDFKKMIVDLSFYWGTRNHTVRVF